MIIVRHSVVHGFALQGFSCWTQRYSAFEAKLEFLPKALTANALLRSVPPAFFSDFRWFGEFVFFNLTRPVHGVDLAAQFGRRHAAGGHCAD